ncbi:MAG: hypothetical protein JKY56_03315, partial [Kofleriaceae bacterium]|nr:hypothetical protein [Kofleriaceae bacterium]
KVAKNFCGAAKLTGVTRDTPKGPEAVSKTGLFSGGTVTVEEVHIDGTMTVRAGDATASFKPNVRTLPGWLSILPPLAAILLALIFREALIALFAGIWLGAFFVYDYNPLTALVRVFDTHLVASVAESGHASILLFTMALGGMVGILAKSGGTNALVDVLSKRAKTRRSGMIVGWLTGLAIFFDDYANCLLVGKPFALSPTS